MHYRNGREANNGDKVARIDEVGHIEVVGTLEDAVPGNDYCNGNIRIAYTNEITYACMCDCLHIDDLAVLLAEKGLDKRPEGK